GLADLDPAQERGARALERTVRAERTAPRRARDLRRTLGRRGDGIRGEPGRRRRTGLSLPIERARFAQRVDRVRPRRTVTAAAGDRCRPVHSWSCHHTRAARGYGLGMASEHDNRLLPLRREFNQAWHGFDRTQVLQYVEHLEAQIQRIVADRDNAHARLTTASRELENARREVTRLQNRVEELKKPPERPEDLDERMQRSIDLANTRAAEIVSRAEEAATKTWAESGEVSKKLHERYMKLVETLDNHAEALQREHTDALAATKADVERMTAEAAKRQERLDTEAEQKRRTIERE